MRTPHEKALCMEEALRMERDRLRGSRQLVAANAINHYLQQADQDSFARLYDIIMGFPKG